MVRRTQTLGWVALLFMAGTGRAQNLPMPRTLPATQPAPVSPAVAAPVAHYNGPYMWVNLPPPLPAAVDPRTGAWQQVHYSLAGRLIQPGETPPVGKRCQRCFWSWLPFFRTHCQCGTATESPAPAPVLTPANASFGYAWNEG